MYVDLLVTSLILHQQGRRRSARVAGRTPAPSQVDSAMLSSGDSPGDGFPQADDEEQDNVEEEEEEDNAEGLIRIHGRAAGPGDEILNCLLNFLL